MQHGEIDLAIMGRPPDEIGARADTFAGHPFVFIAPPGHALVGRRGIVPARLESEPMIVREPESGTRDAMQRYCAQHRITPRIAMEMPSSEAIKQAVMAGMGIAFQSLHTIGLELSHGLLTVLDVDGTPVMRRWNVVHLSTKVLSPAAEAFRYFILEHGEAYLAQHDAALVLPFAKRESRPKPRKAPARARRG